MRPIISIPLTTAAILLGLTACAAGPNTATESVTPNTIILDVRTAEERSSGYLAGSQHLDFNSGEFSTALPALDTDAEYLLYCRSGNRAGQALKLMEEAGFTNITNLGSLEEATATTGLAIVK